MAENLTSFRMFLASCTGNAKNVTYRNDINIKSAEDLAAACQKDHVCAAFEECRRSNTAYIRGFAFAADCDNDFTDDPAAWITPATMEDALPGVAFYAVKSRNCDKVKHPGEPGEKSARPRWHYYFPLSVPVEGYSAARSLTDSFLYMFPMFDDEGTKPAQFFYGHAEPVAEYHPGTMDIIQYIRGNPIEREPEPEADPEPAAARSLAAVSDDFAALNVQDMLGYISASCDYKTWREIGMAIKAAGLPFEVWDAWSRTAPDMYPGVEKARRKWLSFNGNGITFGTLVYMATGNGWAADSEKLTGEYKANHEAAAAYKERVRLFQETHKEEHRAALAAVGIDTDDPYQYEWTLAYDGSIDTVTDKKTGEIVYTKIRQADPAAAAPKEQKTDKMPSVTGFDDVEESETDYLFYPWFPRGKLVAVQGDSGSSKSTFMYAIGALVSIGADLLGVPCEDPGNVMFLTIEDDPGDIKTAFVDSGGNIGRLLRVEDREEIAKLNLSSAGARKIDNIIKEHDIKLLVLDPIQQFLAGDMNKATETRPQLARLMNIASENHICIVFLEHLGKDTSKAALHRGIGSVDIGAATRSIIQIITDPEDEFYKIAFTVKNNTAPFQDIRQGIRYQVKDHPGSFNHETKKRRHFHGHAELTAKLPEYNERLYRKAQRKAEEQEKQALQKEIDYQADPLVLTVRELSRYNPERFFICTDELIRRITEHCGHCPYQASNNKVFGINSRVTAIRETMMTEDAIQMDLQNNPIQPKAYRWKGETIIPENLARTRGIFITPIKNGSSGSQQTEI